MTDQPPGHLLGADDDALLAALRDTWLRDALNDLGHPNAHGRFVHLFINNLYWGLYNIAERPTASFFADYFGGAKSEWDVVKDFQELHDGNLAR